MESQYCNNSAKDQQVQINEILVAQKQFQSLIRVNILIDKLYQKKKKQWKDSIHQLGDSTKSVSQLKNRDSQQSYQSQKVTIQKQQQYVEYVAKIQQQEEQKLLFNQSLEIQLIDELKNCLKKVGQDPKGQIIFFEEFFIFKQKVKSQSIKIFQALACSDMIDADQQSSKKKIFCWI